MRPSCDRTGDLQEEAHSPPADTEKWPLPETKSLEPTCCIPESSAITSLWCLRAAHETPESTLQGRKQGSERCGKDLPISPNMAGTQVSWFLFSTFSVFYEFAKFFSFSVHRSGAES